MEDLTYEVKKAEAQKHAEEVKQKQELHDIRHSNDKPKEKLSFSKVAFIFMMTNCVVIEIYALVTMLIFADLSPLSTLITAVIGECVSSALYFIKAQHENTTGGIVYETAMKKLEKELENSDDAVG